MRPTPAISAHRRDEAGLTGLGEAAASGAEYVEIDIRRTGDGGWSSTTTPKSAASG
ncbi:hypothetical protein [Actinomadura madurae]|uniref:hypothetical protein n=1 Tax=Actinomadura madurae TaxID=1993 RepID=UPI0020D249B9|nr:hypothetical protein [Actinomadura madurae]MCQ0019442.1 hypothetical protein [Actinomadura madurae]